MKLKFLLPVFALLFILSCGDDPVLPETDLDSEASDNNENIVPDNENSENGNDSDTDSNSEKTDDNADSTDDSGDSQPDKDANDTDPADDSENNTPEDNDTAADDDADTSDPDEHEDQIHDPVYDRLMYQIDDKRVSADEFDRSRDGLCRLVLGRKKRSAFRVAHPSYEASYEEYAEPRKERHIVCHIYGQTFDMGCQF